MIKKDEFVQSHFLVWKCFRKMKVGEKKYIPSHKCPYVNVKSSASQLKKKGEGVWKISKKRVSSCGTINWVDGTYVTREQ